MGTILSSRRLLLLIPGIAVLAGVMLTFSGRHGAADAATAQAPAVHATALLQGIPQHGNALGRDDAPVTVVEYGDLQCPYCAAWSRQALPALIRDYVRPGKVRLVFDGPPFLGSDSQTALRAAIVAGAQGHFWDVVH